ncbi:MAG: bifunctional 4-hydroxy-2-oxoglutarate aldolase/2-dehydro-3-deoxy-phosphogluconate aldolase, partial [Tumebacillaceae bacterium]
MEQLLQTLTDSGIVSIIRGAKPSKVVEIVKALKEGGIKAVEVTLNSDSALRAIDTLSAELGDEMLIGAGTVLDPESARAALLAGAKFILSPTLNVKTIEMTKRYGAVSIPGAFTPTEILTAFEAGGDVIKVFPAGVSGPSYIQDIHGPLKQIPLMPAGGVDMFNVGEYIKSGAAAVALGSSLVNTKAEVDEKYLHELVDKAK